MRSPNFFVPGVIGVVLQIATTFATAMSLVRERERGTLGTVAGEPAVALGTDAGQTDAVSLHRHGDGVRAVLVMRWSVSGAHRGQIVRR